MLWRIAAAEVLHVERHTLNQFHQVRTDWRQSLATAPASTSTRSSARSESATVTWMTRRHPARQVPGELRFVVWSAPAAGWRSEQRVDHDWARSTLCPAIGPMAGPPRPQT